jgi:hypothetical protein
VELSGKIDRVIDAVDRLNSDHLRTASEAKDEWRAVNQNITKDGRDTRHVIIGAIITSVLAALAAIWVTQSNLETAFQTGISLHDSHFPPPQLPKP